MRNLRWQLLIAVGGVILVVVLLIGQAPPTASSPPLPVRGGAYTEAMVGNLSRLNPILDDFNQVDRDIDSLIYSGLIRFDSRGIPMPDLAESWSISADATLCTVRMREDALWHDGEPVTADDVLYTYSKMQDADYPGPADLQAFWQEVEIVRLDEHTVQFRLPESFAPFLDYLSVGLLPDHLLRGVTASGLIDHPFNLQPVGTGPFRFDRFLIEGDGIIGVSFVPYENYYGQQPFLERVEFLFFASPQLAWEAYSTGKAQGIGQVAPEILPQVLGDPHLNVYTGRLPSVGIVFLNQKHAEKTFFAEKRVRQALFMAINRQWLIDLAFAGQAVPAEGPILQGTWAFAEDIRPKRFDPPDAAKLLESIEWELPAGATPGSPEYVRSKDDQTLSFELTFPDDTVHTTIAQALQSSWAALGAQVSLNPVDEATLLTSYLEPRQFEAVLTDLDLSRYPDPDPYPFWHDTQAETGQNYGGFVDRNVSIWLEQARVTPDMSQRIELYRSFQHRFADQVPAFVLYNPVYSFAVDATIQAVQAGPLFDTSDRLASIEGWYLLARRASEPTSAGGP